MVQARELRGVERASKRVRIPVDGDAGADGASAYDVAVANGFVGTEQEWLDSLGGGGNGGGFGFDLGDSTGSSSQAAFDMGGSQ